MEIRSEQPGDSAAIRALVTAAFRDAPHRSGSEAAIVDGLRNAGALTLALVAEDESGLVGHAAFSPVAIADGAAGWVGLGPVAVRPDRQGGGIGRALIDAGLSLLRQRGVSGCVVLGDPAYYGRFGFVSDPALRYGDVPAGYFQRLSFTGARPSGAVRYHPAFDL